MTTVSANTPRNGAESFQPHIPQIYSFNENTAESISHEPPSAPRSTRAVSPPPLKRRIGPSNLDCPGFGPTGHQTNRARRTDISPSCPQYVTASDRESYTDRSKALCRPPNKIHGACYTKTDDLRAPSGNDALAATNNADSWPQHARQEFVGHAPGRDINGRPMDDMSSVTSNSSKILQVRHRCRQCGEPESAIRQLIPCTLCPRSFHPYCGNPSPSATRPGCKFVCGKCLQTQRKTPRRRSLEASDTALEHIPTANRDVAPGETTTSAIRSPTEPLSMRASAVSYLTPHSATSTTLISTDNGTNWESNVYGDRNAKRRKLDSDANEPSTTLSDSSRFGAVDSPPTTSNAAKAPLGPATFNPRPVIDFVGPPKQLVKENAQVDPGWTGSSVWQNASRYKAITCCHWERGYCKNESFPERCHFAHRSTDYLQPMNRDSRRAKAFTCFDFRERGSCSRRQCSFSHHDTGLYVNSAGHASMRHVTCAHWFQRRYCNRGAGCNWAHYDTGIHVDYDNGLKDPVKILQGIAAYESKHEATMSGSKAMMAPSTPELEGDAASPTASSGQSSAVEPLSTPEYSPLNVGHNPPSPTHGIDTPFSPSRCINSEDVHSRPGLTRDVPFASATIGHPRSFANSSATVIESVPKKQTAKRSRDALAITKLMKFQNPSSAKDRASAADADEPAVTVNEKPVATNASKTSIQKCLQFSCKSLVMGSTLCMMCKNLEKSHTATVVPLIGAAAAGRKDQPRTMPIIPLQTPTRTTSGSLVPGEKRNTTETSLPPFKRDKEPSPVVGYASTIGSATAASSKSSTELELQQPCQRQEVAKAVSSNTVHPKIGRAETYDVDQDHGTGSSTDGQSIAESNGTVATTVDEPIDETNTSEDKVAADLIASHPTSSPPQLPKVAKRCGDCRGPHLRYLHDAAGSLDPGACADYPEGLDKRQSNPSRRESEMKEARDGTGTKIGGAAANPGQQYDKSDPQESSPLRGSHHSEAGIAPDNAIANRASASTGAPSPDDEVDTGDDTPLQHRRRVRLREGDSTSDRSNGPKSNQTNESDLRELSQAHSQAVEALSTHQGGTGVTDQPAYAYDGIQSSHNPPVRSHDQQPGNESLKKIESSSNVPEYRFLQLSNLQPFCRSKPVAMAAPQKPLRTAARDVDLDSVIAKLKGRGIVFEDSSDEEMQEPAQTETETEPIQFPWQSLHCSRNLYDVAPLLRPEGPVLRNTRSVNLKTRPDDLLKDRLQKRSAQHGREHPHRVRERQGNARVATTTRLEDHTTQTWRDPLDLPVAVSVAMPIEEYMGLPADAVFVRDGRDELVFKDAQREREGMASRRGLRSRASGIEQRWYF